MCLCVCDHVPPCKNANTEKEGMDLLDIVFDF